MKSETAHTLSPLVPPAKWMVAASMLGALCLGLACSKKSEPPGGTTSSVEKTSPSVADATPPRGTGGGPAGSVPVDPHGPTAVPTHGSLAIEWTTPSAWKETGKVNAMRRVTYAIEGAAGAAELAVFYFGQTAAGSTEANLDRWVKQFEGGKDTAERTEFEVGEHQITLLSIASGTYAGGMLETDRGKKENYGLLAAIATSQAGPHYFKLTGPSATVLAERPRFEEMLRSIRSRRP